MRLGGKNAIVTGAARGIGAAIATRLCDEGAGVLIVDRLAEEGRKTAGSLRADGHRCDFVEADVTDETAWNSIVTTCEAGLGAPGVLVNNAGINRYEPLVEETLDGWREVIDANLTSVFLGMRAVIPRMITAGGGAIVNISSTWGLVAAESAAAYHASKGGVALLTKNAAVTYATHGIRANSIHPGPV